PPARSAIFALGSPVQPAQPAPMADRSLMCSRLSACAGKGPEEMNNRRQDARFTLPAAYAPVQIRLLDDHAGRGLPGDLLGHAYDISATGLRFELAEPLPAAARFAIRLELPGRPGGIAPRPGEPRGR